MKVKEITIKDPCINFAKFSNINIGVPFRIKNKSNVFMKIKMQYEGAIAVLCLDNGYIQSNPIQEWIDHNELYIPKYTFVVES